MIRLLMWGWWLLRSLQRVQPAEGEPCALCGRTSSQPAIAVSGPVFRVDPDDPHAAALAAALRAPNGPSDRRASQGILEDTARRMGYGLDKYREGGFAGDDEDPPPTGAPV